MNTSRRGAAPTLPAQVSPPEFALSDLPVGSVSGAQVVAFPVLPGDDGDVLVSTEADEYAADIDLLAVLAAEREPATAGQVTQIPVTRGRTVVLMLLVGVGDGSDQALRRAGAAVARAGRDKQAVVTSIPAGAPASGLSAFVIGAMLGSFAFHWRSVGPEHTPVERIVLAGLDDAEERREELLVAVATGGAAWRARLLATVPSNLKSPAWLAEQARDVAAVAGLDVDVWEVPALEKAGMGGILGVGQASATPPCLIRLDYTPAKANRRTPRIVLVGKGITFDTGGLSIKPAQSMTTMKRDMTGGAVVISVLAALADVGCPVKVTGLIAAAENAVSGNSLRPGDVVRHYGGRTSEVNNTDAEGRLVLADAMAYAVDKLEPAAMVDVATLTGAIKVALGQGIAGFFADNDTLADLLREAGDRAGEPMWRMPLVADYEEKLNSKIADADNAPGGPGAITAALFLQHFTGNVPWAHLDIASVGDAPKDSFEWTAGPTGYGVRALLAWLGTENPLEGVS